MREEEKVEINEVHFTEAFERAYLLGQIIEIMSGHPVFVEYQELKEIFEQIKGLTYRLYQLVGRCELTWLSQTLQPEEYKILPKQTEESRERLKDLLETKAP